MDKDWLKKWKWYRQFPPRRPSGFSVISGWLMLVGLGATALLFQHINPLSHEPWESLGSPPSGAHAVLQIGLFVPPGMVVKDYPGDLRVWVLGNDGSVYSNGHHCVLDTACGQWRPELDLPSLPKSNVGTIHRGPVCISASGTPMPSPGDALVECAVASYGSDRRLDAFAILQDGSIMTSTAFLNTRTVVVRQVCWPALLGMLFLFDCWITYDYFARGKQATHPKRVIPLKDI